MRAIGCSAIGVGDERSGQKRKKQNERTEKKGERGRKRIKKKKRNKTRGTHIEKYSNNDKKTFKNMGKKREVEFASWA